MNPFNLFFILMLVLLASCASNTASSKMGVHNPASVYCAEQAGQLRIMKDGKGEYGFCYFEDGSHCEEWAFFRKECDKGQQFSAE